MSFYDGNNQIRVSTSSSLFQNIMVSTQTYSAVLMNAQLQF